MYYDVPAPVTPPGENPRDEHDGIVEMIMDFSSQRAITRLFQIKLSQIPFSQRAPAGCMQYFTDVEGIIQVIFPPDLLEGASWRSTLIRLRLPDFHLKSYIGQLGFSKQFNV